MPGNFLLLNSVCDKVLPNLAVLRVIVIYNDLIAMWNSLTLMDTNSAFRGTNTSHGHFVQQLTCQKPKTVTKITHNTPP